MPKKLYCCKTFEQSITLNCSQHKSPFDCVDVLFYKTKAGKYGIIIHDGGSSYIEMKYCPYCGKKLK